MKAWVIESLSKSELIKIILDQAQIIADLKIKIEDQERSHKKEIQVLTSKIEELTRASKRQAAPFRRDEKKLKKKKKSPGQKPGHKGDYR